MTIIAQDTYDKSTQIIDKDKIFVFHSWNFYEDEACTIRVTKFINSRNYYLVVDVENLYQWDDIIYDNIYIYLQNNYGSITGTFDSFITDNSTYKKGKYKLTFNEFSGNDVLTAISFYVHTQDNIIKSYQFNPHYTVYNYILKRNIIHYFDIFYNVAVDNDGNYVAVGMIDGVNGIYGAMIFKFDSNLNVLAGKLYANTSFVEFKSIAIDNDGNYIVVGYTNIIGQGSDDGLIVKFDSNLNILAAKTYGTTLDDQFKSIAIDNDGNYIAIGGTYSGNQGSENALIVKFDNNLNILAAKIYGGSNGDYFNSVAVDANGDYISVGYTYSEGQGSHDALIVKFDSSLNKLAAKVYGGSDSDIFKSVTVDSSGNYIIAGITESEGQGNSDALIVKFDNNLNMLAAKIYGGTDYDIFKSVTVDNYGNYIVVGYNHHDLFIIKFDNNLNILAAKTYSGSNNDFFKSVTVDSSGNYIVAGYYVDSDIKRSSFISKISFLPPGSFTSNLGYVFDDSNLTLANSNLILANISSFTLIDSDLILANSNLTLTDLAYTEIEDKILA